MEKSWVLRAQWTMEAETTEHLFHLRVIFYPLNPFQMSLVTYLPLTHHIYHVQDISEYFL